MKLEDVATQITPFLWLGSQAAGEAPYDLLKSHNITHICVPANIYGPKPVPFHNGHFRYLILFVADMPAFPIIRCFPMCCDFIDEARRNGGAVLVHCAEGVSRSASVVCAWMMKERKKDYITCYGELRQLRRQVSSKFESQLKLWEKMGWVLDEADASYRRDYSRGGPNAFVKGLEGVEQVRF